MPGTMVFSFAPSPTSISVALVEHAHILCCRRGKHIVEIAERITELAHGRCDAALRNLRRLRRRRLRSDDAAAHGDGSRLGASIDAELGEEVGDMGLHGACTDKER